MALTLLLSTEVINQARIFALIEHNETAGKTDSLISTNSHVIPLMVVDDFFARIILWASAHDAVD